MKTILAYALGFSMTFTVIAGGMYFLSEKYPWMFGQSDAQTTQSSSKTAAADSDGLVGLHGNGASGDSAGVNETILTLKKMLAAKNDSLAAKDDSIQTLNSTLTQLQQKSSDANSVISQLQNQVKSWKSKSRQDLASAYNDMDPSAAAKIMENLDNQTIVFILSSIQKKQAGRILGQLDPARAAKIMMSLSPPK